MNRITTDSNKVFFVMLFMISSSLFLTYYELVGLGNDYPVFHDAALRVLHWQSPWGGSGDHINSAYLNGPISTFLIAPAGLLPEVIGLFLVRLISLISIPLIIANLNHFFEEGTVLSRKRIFQISTLSLFTFPVRANLEYGQLFIIFLLIFSLGIKCISEENASSKYRYLSSGLCIWTCTDYKPHVFAPILIYLVIKHKKLIRGVSLGIISGGIISLVITRQPPYLTWLESLLRRNKNLDSGLDQMNLWSLVRTNTASLFLLLITLTIFVLLRSGRQTRLQIAEKQQMFFHLVILFPLLTIFLHPTDLILPIFLGLIEFFRFYDFRFFLFLGFAIVWSNKLSLIGICIVGVSVLLHKYIRKKEFLLLPLPSLIFYATIAFSPSLESGLRKSLNYLSLATLYILFLVQLRYIRLGRKHEVKNQQVELGDYSE